MPDKLSDKWDGGDAEMEGILLAFKDRQENPGLPSLGDAYAALFDCEAEAREAGNETALAEIEATRNDPEKLKAFRVKLKQVMKEGAEESASTK